jgi:hypothetical protein
MAKFNLENYETVEERLKLFWKDNPNGRIFTEVVHETEDGSCVTIRALVYVNADDLNPIATGIAQETKGQGGFANTDAWVENCETSAIGRALANWKYQGSGKARPSKEEMSKVVNKDNVAVKESAKTTAESSKKFSEDVGAVQTVAETLNIFIETFSQDKKAKATAKKTAYEQTVQEGADKDVENWTEENREMFYAFFEVAINISDVFGDVVVKQDNDKIICDKCKTSDWVEDNTEKKASDPAKYGKIPSLVCSNYGSSQGCGTVIEW